VRLTRAPLAGRDPARSADPFTEGKPVSARPVGMERRPEFPLSHYGLSRLKGG